MDIKEIKQRFFCFRNGIVAEALRRGGYPQKVIFGLELPRIAEIARECGTDAALARALWEDAEVRESRLLAAYLFDPAALTEDEALALAAGVRTPEEADMLAFRIFKRMPDAHAILAGLERRAPESRECRLCAESLKRHLA